MNNKLVTLHNCCMKIIFWYLGVFKQPSYDLCYRRHQARSSLFIKHEWNEWRLLGQVFLYVCVYVSPQICPSYFKVGFWGSFRLMLKSFGVSVSKCFIHLILRVFIITMPNSFSFSILYMMVIFASLLRTWPSKHNMCVCVCVCVCKYITIYMSVCLCIYKRIYVCMCACVCIYI